MKEEKLELKVDKAYSKDELTKDFNLTMIRFHSGFSLFYNKKIDKVEFFRIYAPPKEEPKKRFYYQHQTGYNESYGS